MARIDPAKVRREFAQAVNLSAKELRDWLRTDESRSVGWKGKDGTAAESVGHAVQLHGLEFFYRWLIQHCLSPIAK